MAFYTYSITYDGSVKYNNTSIGAVPISYNGVSKPALSASKSLDCQNNAMAGDLKIGEKTLGCKNKLMKTNVVIGVSEFTIRPISDAGIVTYGENTATVRWKVGSGGQYTATRIRYKSGGWPSGPEDSSASAWSGTGTYSNPYQTVALSGLSKGTTYYFRLYPYYISDGKYCYGSVIQTSVTTSCSCNGCQGCYGHCSCNGHCNCNSCAGSYSK